MFKILVVEDEPHLRKIIATSLKQEGYRVIECHDGQCAWDTFCSEHIDLIDADDT